MIRKHLYLNLKFPRTVFGCSECPYYVLTFNATMNWFWLHSDRRTLAYLHANEHCVKMILEATQVLSNTYHHYHGNGHYKKTHVRHPVSIFVAQNKRNFCLLLLNALQLCVEYTTRYTRTHKCEGVLVHMWNNPPNFSLGTPPPYNDDQVFGLYQGVFRVPLCMPPEFYNADACIAYRKYYTHKLDTLKLRWTHGDIAALRRKMA